MGKQPENNFLSSLEQSVSQQQFISHPVDKLQLQIISETSLPNNKHNIANRFILQKSNTHGKLINSLLDFS